MVRQKNSFQSRVCVADVVTGYDLEAFGLIVGKEPMMCLYSTAWRPILGLTQPPLHWVLEAIFPRRLAGTAGSSPSSEDAKNNRAVPPLHFMS
jgi:hypothetical protein